MSDDTLVTLDMAFGEPSPNETDSQRLQRIEEKLDALITAHDDMVEKVNDIIDNVKPHLDDIAPMIDAIASNPMFRMFTGGRKKDKEVTP